MKVLDVDLFQEGLQLNITMLTRLSTEIEAIHRAVEGLVQMEDQLKGEGGNAIRSFYEECHLPFLQFFQLFSVHYQQVLHQMDAALYSLEPDSSGYILETFLEGELEQGLTEIGHLTASLTDETNSIMDQVSDIVGLPHLDDSGVQEGIVSSKRKRDDTISQLYEFDATQTSALHVIEQDMQTMETWLSDLEGMFESGLTDIHFQTENWGVLTSKNNLKTELAYRTSPIAGLSNLSNRENQLTTMLQAFTTGSGPIRFGYGGLISIHHPFVGTDMIALSCPRPEVNGMEQEDINQNPFVKSFHTFKGIAEDFWNGVGIRRDKALDSPYDFVNYWTFGVSDGILSGAKERKDMMFDSKTDFANYATIGFSGMVKEAIFPEESFSKEHWQNSFGFVGSLIGLRLASSPSLVKKPGNATGDGKAIGEGKNLSENANIGATNKFNFVDNAKNHLKNVENVNTKKGIVGGHNMDEFNKALKNQGFKSDDLIVSKKAHPSIEGIFEVEYKIPRKDISGNIAEPVSYKNIKEPKTVYDPSKISDEKIYQWGQEAMQNGKVNGRLVEGTASNSLKFRGYLNEAGEITNFFPVID